MLIVRCRLWLLALGDLVLLVALRGEPARLVRVRDLVDGTSVDAVAARLSASVLWLAAVWFGVGLLACVVAAAPGSPGRVATRIARATLPRAVYRLAAGAVGLGVLLAPADALAHGVASRPMSATVVPAPTWPTDDPLPTPAWPSDPAPQRPPGPTPSRPRQHDAAEHHAAEHPPTPEAGSGRRPVVVRPGDSLWRIAAQHLPAHSSARRIAAQWPRWYAANRRVIGTDPDHILAGQVLVPPDTRTDRRSLP